MTETSHRLKYQAARIGPVPRDVGAALAALPDDELLRLRAVARLRARSLPGGVSWSDLLHEAVVRALAGTRPWPPGVPLIAFLAGIMRSLCNEQWRRRRREEVLSSLDAAGARQAHDPERAYAAAEAFGAVHRLFASDEAATKIITGLMAGLDAGQIRSHYGLGAVEYDTARRRMRRAMLRHGLAWSWP